jgi:hypothetical protein
MDRLWQILSLLYTMDDLILLHTTRKKQIRWLEFPVRRVSTQLSRRFPISQPIRWSKLWLVLLGGLLAGCLPLATPLPPLPTDTPAPTVPATATIEWFPATATNTPLPSPTLPLTPTLNTKPQLGPQLLNDSFSDPTPWKLGKGIDGIAALGQKELTLAIARPHRTLVSLRRQPSLSDFYLEVTASPSICRGEDEYGVMFHVTPRGDYFRFVVTCDGKTRVDRFFNQQGSTPQPLVVSGSVPLGAPSSSRLGVYSIGRQMLFYINGEYLFKVSDPTLPSGGIGLYARAAAEDVVTVNFLNLVVYQVTS